MADPNTLITPTMIAKEGLRLLKNNLVMGSSVYRAYEAEFPGSPRKGGTVQIRKPVKFTVTKSRVRSSSVITEQYITMTVATQAHVSWAFTSNELTMKIEEYSERYIRPACAKLANTVDGDLCALYADIPNTVWESSGFVTPHTFMCLGKAMQKMDEEAAPPEDRCVVFNPAAHWGMANALSQLYVQSAAEKALRKGYLGSIAGADILMDQNIKSHQTGLNHDTGSTNSDAIHVGLTAGTGIPTGIVVGASANQSFTMIDFRVTANLSLMLKIGDWFEINGVYAVNPMSGESTGSRRQFVVTADVSARTGTETTSGGAVTVYVQPDCISTGPYKTVDTIPAAQAIAYFYETPGKQYPMNLAFHKNAFALVFVPLEVPQGAAFSASVTEDGYSMRVVKDYDIDNDLEVIRLDILYGVKTIYPELAVRIAGAEQ